MGRSHVGRGEAWLTLITFVVRKAKVKFQTCKKTSENVEKGPPRPGAKLSGWEQEARR